MLSSVNAFGGLSSAELLTLFGAHSSSSPSDSKATNAGQSPSSGVSGSIANNPANAIKAILAQAQIDQAQAAASWGGAAVSTTAESAYAETGSSGSLVTSDTVSELNNAGIESGTSLVVGTANGVVSITTGNTPQFANYLSTDTLEGYQDLSMLAQQMQAESSVPDSTSNAPSTPASDGTDASIGTPQAGHPVLILSIGIENPFSAPQGTGLYAYVEAQAQQLMSSFEDNTLLPTSSNATGFGYQETDGAATSISIGGMEVSDFGSSQIPGLITDQSANTIAGVQDLVDQSTEYFGAYNNNTAGFTFIIPLGGS